MKNSPLLLVGLLSTLAVAQSLPDDIDVAKYSNILQQSLQILQDKKSQLSSVQSQASKVQSQIRDVDAQINQREQDIAQLMRVLDEKGRLAGAASQENVNFNAEREHLLIDIRTANRDLDILAGQIPQQDRIVGQLTREYNAKKSQLDQIDVLMNDSDAKVKSQNEKIAKVDADIASLNKQNSDLLGQKNNLTTQINQTNSTIISLQSSILSLQNEIPQLQKDIDSLNTSIANSQSQIPQLQTKLSNAQAAVPAKQSKVNEIQSQISPLQSKASDLGAQIQQVKNEINAIHPKLQMAKREQNQQLVQQLEKQLNELKARLNELTLQLTATNNQIAGLSSSLSQSQTELASAEHLVSDLTKQITDLNKSIQSMQSSVTSKTNKIAKNKTDLAKAQQDLTANQAKVTQLQQQLSALEPQLAEFNQKLNQLNQRKKVLLDELASLKLENQRLANLRAPIYQEAKQKYDILARESTTLENMKHSQRELVEHRERARNRVVVIEARMADNARLVSALQNDMAAIQTQINGIDSSENSLKQQRDQYLQNLGVINQQIATIQTSVQTAQAQVDTDNQKLQQVKAKYQAQFDIAYNQGANVGSRIGDLMGGNIGAKEGKPAGISQGKSAGTLEGELSSFQTGLQNGLDQGKTDGYNKGKNAPANYQQGFDLGYSSGKAQAETEAQQTSYRDARAQKKAELLLDIPSQSIEINQGESILANVKVDNISSSAILKDSMNVSSDPQDAEGTIKAKILSLQSQRDREARKNADASRTPAEPGSINVDLSQANCNSQPMTEFKNACLRGYEESFRGAYEQSYGTAWLEARNAEFGKAYDSALTSSKNSKTKQGFDEAYSSVSSEYEQIGAQESQKTGFADGKSKGYSDNLSIAQAKAIKAGMLDEADYFASHAVLRVSSLAIVEGSEKVGLSPGSTALIDLNVINFGQKQSKDGQSSVQLIAESSNVQVSTSNIGISSIPARTQTLVHQFTKVKILPTAKLGEEVKIRLIATHSDGAREEKVLSFKVGIKMNLALTVSTDMNPKMKGFLGLGAKKHLIQIQVQNLSENLLNKTFTVIGSSPKAGVVFKTVSATTTALAKGQASVVEISYKIKDRGLKLQSLPLEFTVLYDGKAEVAKTSISVTPK